jgi:hypothetical protein
VVRAIPLQAGDTLVAHTPWDALARLEKNPEFVVVTTEYPHEELRPQKVQFAALFFGIAMALVLFSDMRLSLALLVGAIGDPTRRGCTGLRRRRLDCPGGHENPR